MKKNFEIKVKLSDPKKTGKLVRLLCKGKSPIRQKQTQEDIYYRTNKGRLKLRIINGNTGNLIHYFRSNESSKRVSNYTISETNTPKELNATLSSLFGIFIVVKKVREITIIDNVRIHIDKVAGLGNYLEIEIIFNSIKDARKRMDVLIDALELGSKKFINVSYSDLLLNKRKNNAT
ncbi:MAG: class IV adenylate cyclase [Ignavibacteriota bacterium]|nr:class IV adenylate cyclase [Ignavibacteriota bacterium]